MRTREDIEKEFDEMSRRIDVGAGNIFVLEVLLDIRDLLQNPPVEISGKMDERVDQL